MFTITTVEDHTVWVSHPVWVFYCAGDTGYNVYSDLQAWARSENKINYNVNNIIDLTHATILEVGVDTSVSIMAHNAEKKRVLDATDHLLPVNILAVIPNENEASHSFAMPYNPKMLPTPSQDCSTTGFKKLTTIWMSFLEPGTFFPTQRKWRMRRKKV
jgi:hypothetical protein